MRFVLFVLVVSAVVVAGTVTFIARGSGTHTKPTPAVSNRAASNGLGDDDANLMRVLQRQKLAQAGK